MYRRYKLMNIVILIYLFFFYYYNYDYECYLYLISGECILNTDICD